MNSQQAKRSLLGLLISLLIHGAIVGALLWNWHKPSEAQVMLQVKYLQRFRWK